MNNKKVYSGGMKGNVTFRKITQENKKLREQLVKVEDLLRIVQSYQMTENLYEEIENYFRKKGENV